MNLARKLATGAVGAGLAAASLFAATPASATVYNVSCPSGGVTIHSDYGLPDYCYDWDGTFGGNNNLGWMDLPDTKQVCPGDYTGYVVDTGQNHFNFRRGGGCVNTGGAHLQYIVFTGN